MNVLATSVMANSRVWSMEEMQAVSDTMARLDRDAVTMPDRTAMVRFALRMHRRGFRDPEKLVILCRKADHLGHP